MDGTIIVQVSELTSFIVKSNGDLPHLTAMRLSVFTRVVTNRFLHVSPQDCVVLGPFRAVQCRNKVWNATKGRIRTLSIP